MKVVLPPPAGARRASTLGTGGVQVLLWIEGHTNSIVYRPDVIVVPIGSVALILKVYDPGLCLDVLYVLVKTLLFDEGA